MDPRKIEIQDTWWDWEESTPNIQAAEQSADHFLWLLLFHGINLRTAKILELGSGQWYLLDLIKKKWIHITGIDACPRPYRDDIEIHKVDITELSKIFSVWFYHAIISRDVFDTRYYNQDIPRIAKEFSHVLWNKWIYVAKEPNMMDLEIPGAKKWVIAGQFQIFRKSWWFIAERYDFSKRVSI